MNASVPLSPWAPIVAAVLTATTILLVSLSLAASFSAARATATGQAPMATWHATPADPILTYSVWTDRR